MSMRFRDLTFRHVIFAGLALLAVLLAVGFATRENVAQKPYLKIAGASFIFNYRVGEAYYGFTAEVLKPVRNNSTIEAEFENPAGGPPFLVAEKLTPRSKRYGLRTPPLRGIAKDKPYHVTVRLLQQGDGAVLFADTFTVASQISDAVVPPKPLTIGPGYAKNPEMPDGWTKPASAE